MALALKNGDYINENGTLLEVSGQDALLQRVLFKLTARRGSFPFLPELGSRLWELGRIPAGTKKSAAQQFVAEALADENLTVENVTLTPVDDTTMELTAELRWNEKQLHVNLNVS
ncbi:MAG: hypothetical protein MJ073_00785 [Oscillibacter sp.]|nr:hypothetical protein [Oscillibacter sp.]